MIIIFASPYFGPLCLMGFAAVFATLCVQLDPKDERNSSFYGLMAAGLVFVIGFNQFVEALLANK